MSSSSLKRKTPSDEPVSELAAQPESSPAPQKLRIGEILVHEGLITADQVDLVLALQKTRHPTPPFGELCVELGFLTPTTLGKILSKHHERVPLGEILVHLGLISTEQIQVALESQRKTKKRLGTILVEQCLLATDALVNALYQQAQLAKQHLKRQEAMPLIPRISTQELAAAAAAAREQRRPLATVLMEQFRLNKQEAGWALSTHYKCPFVAYNQHVKLAPSLLQNINLNYLKTNYWLPLRAEEEWVEILTDDPHSFTKLRDIKHLFPGKQIRWAVGLREDILKFVSKLVVVGNEQENPSLLSSESLSSSPPPSDTLSHEMLSAAEEERDEIFVDENDSNVVRIVNQILTEAINSGASDIHIEPYGRGSGSLVRFRVDGVCHEGLRIPAEYHRSLVSRLKILARLDIAERRKPQDGKLKFRHSEQEVELRMVTLPTATREEDVVLRVLVSTGHWPLQKLSMTQRNFQELIRVLEKPYGMLLCTGPTGSGKTTTLHAALGHLNTPGKKIWTAEDPIEITQPGLRQVQIMPKIGLTFAATMRSFLRADPDIIMVGEIRDQETAEVTTEASLTGHLVLSTLHTNNAPETITRLLDMGIDPFTFADALLGVLAQRLARTICQHCKERYHPTKEEYETLAHGYGENAFVQLGIPYNDLFTLYRGKGCSVCRNTGYRGRMGLHEFLVVTAEIRDLIHGRAPVVEVRKVAQAQGMTTLVQDGILKVLSGLTDYTQVRAVAMR